MSQPLLVLNGPGSAPSEDPEGRESAPTPPPAEVSIFGKESHRRDNGRAFTSFLVLSYMIGSGILNQPQVFSKSGIAAAAALYIFAGYGTWLGLVVLIKAAERLRFTNGIGNGNGGTGPPGSHDHHTYLLGYAELATEACGPAYAAVADAAVVVANFGSCCSYALVIGSLLSSLVTEELGVDASSVWASLYAVVPLVTVVLVLPVCLIRHFSNLRLLAVLSVMTVAVVWAMVVFWGPFYAKQEGVFDDDSTVDTSLVWWSWLGMGTKAGSVIFAISSAPCAFHAYVAMSPREEWLWRQSTAWAVGAGLLACTSMGLVGYLSFRSSTEGDILDNFDGLGASVVKLIVTVHLILFIPNEFVVLRHSLVSFFGGDVMKMNFPPVLLVTVAMLAAIVGLVLGLTATGASDGDMFGYILDFTGGVTNSLTSFVFPALFYLRVTTNDVHMPVDAADPGLTPGGVGNVANEADGGGGRESGVSGTAAVLWQRRRCWGLVVFGVAMMIVVPISLVLQVLEDSS